MRIRFSFRQFLQLILFVSLFEARSAGLGEDQSQLGKIDFPTSASGEVQAHFIRGILALHSFFYEEALEAFQAATRIAPGFMMGYWGEAMSHNHPLWAEQDTEAGRAAVARFRDLESQTPRERGFFEAVKALYGDGGKLARDQAYAAAMEKLHRQYPDDQEVAAFYALALLGTVRPGDKGFRRQIEAGAIALEIYRRNPSHPGAAHYIIHSFDDPEHAILALPAARRYAEIAPEAPHARHMPSHIFMQLGMWSDSRKSNESAWNASDAWVKRKNLAPDKRDYHSLHWMMYTLLQQGRFAEAEKKIAVMREFLKEMGPEVRSARLYPEMLASFIVETRNWRGATQLFHDINLASPKPTAAPPGGAYASRLDIVVAYTLGMAADEVAEIEKHAAQLLKLGQKATESGEPYKAKQVEIMRLEVEARAKVRRKEYDPAISLLDRATALEEALSPPSGPPEVIQPSHELLGEVLLEAGGPDEAMTQFQTSLSRQPNRLRSLMGYARAAGKAGKAEAAAATYGRLLKQLDRADADLPELAETRQFLADHPSR